VINLTERILVKVWLCYLSAVGWLVDRLEWNCRFARFCLVIEQFEDGRTILIHGLEEGDPALDVDESHARE
jgi:hypothetical protein